ncbi:hypothetical protein BOTBODRAFT_182679 [Botryobasidium botryosum FD-172 SS1]|uniref:Uncharacterized protein n=1 Tax=Botryobasidium botryosum (strain FD-172 SS1) TaxID=930990 RepID=A0A067N0F6_BOTB1|nr:hypothetical protein BOTBODRAFT_182679 [Botryobasidium botryosum FD-172 SS1]
MTSSDHHDAGYASATSQTPSFAPRLRIPRHSLALGTSARSLRISDIDLGQVESEDDGHYTAPRYNSNRSESKETADFSKSFASGGLGASATSSSSVVPPVSTDVGDTTMPRAGDASLPPPPDTPAARLRALMDRMQASISSGTPPRSSHYSQPSGPPSELESDMDGDMDMELSTGADDSFKGMFERAGTMLQQGFGGGDENAFVEEFLPQAPVTSTPKPTIGLGRASVQTPLDGSVSQRRSSLDALKAHINTHGISESDDDVARTPIVTSFLQLACLTVSRPTPRPPLRQSLSALRAQLESSDLTHSPRVPSPSLESYRPPSAPASPQDQIRPASVSSRSHTPPTPPAAPLNSSLSFSEQLARRKAIFNSQKRTTTPPTPASYPHHSLFSGKTPRPPSPEARAPSPPVTQNDSSYSPRRQHREPSRGLPTFHRPYGQAQNQTQNDRSSQPSPPVSENVAPNRFPSFSSSTRFPSFGEMNLADLLEEDKPASDSAEWGLPPRKTSVKSDEGDIASSGGLQQVAAPEEEEGYGTNRDGGEGRGGGESVRGSEFESSLTFSDEPDDWVPDDVDGVTESERAPSREPSPELERSASFSVSASQPWPRSFQEEPTAPTPERGALQRSIPLRISRSRLEPEEIPRNDPPSAPSSPPHPPLFFASQSQSRTPLREESRENLLGSSSSSTRRSLISRLSRTQANSMSRTFSRHTPSPPPFASGSIPQSYTPPEPRSPSPTAPPFPPSHPARASAPFGAESSVLPSLSPARGEKPAATIPSAPPAPEFPLGRSSSTPLSSPPHGRQNEPVVPTPPSTPPALPAARLPESTTPPGTPTRSASMPAPSTPVLVTPRRKSFQMSRTFSQFQTPSPPKGLPELPDPPSASETEDDRGVRNAEPAAVLFSTPGPKEADVNGGDNGVGFGRLPPKTPKFPGAWATPAPPKLIQRVSDTPSPPPPTRARSVSPTQPVAGSSKSAEPLRPSFVPFSTGDVTPLPRVFNSRFPPKTPAPPGGWNATPKSILKVRFDGDAARAAALPALDGTPTGLGEKRVTIDAEKSPPTGFHATLRRRSKMRMVDAFGADVGDDEEPVEQMSLDDTVATEDPSTSELGRSTSTPRKRSRMRVVDEFGNSLDEVTGLDDSPALGRGPGGDTRSTIAAVKRSIRELAEEWDREDSYSAEGARPNNPTSQRATSDNRLSGPKPSSSAVRAELARLQRQQQLLRSERMELEEKMQQFNSGMHKSENLNLPVEQRPISRKRRTGWVWVVLVLELVLFLVVMRAASYYAKYHFMTVYYDPLYPALFTPRHDSWTSWLLPGASPLAPRDGGGPMRFLGLDKVGNAITRTVDLLIGIPRGWEWGAEGWTRTLTLDHGARHRAPT